MGQQQSNLLAALEKARQQGFIDDYIVNENGQVMSGSTEISNPEIIEMIPCLACGATLYLIAGSGKYGTWIHHWEL